MKNIVVISPHKQSVRLREEHVKCLARLSLMNTSWYEEDVYCDGVFDGIMCWPPTLAGRTATNLCPDYFNGFTTVETASKVCTENGSWFFHPDHNITWTNYSACAVNISDSTIHIPQLIKSNMWRLRLMYNIGYGISLVSLLMALVIMISLKKLYCPRNLIHINLFLSFILRATISFLKENLLVEGLGFENDIIRLPDVGIIFNPDESHWQCRLLFTVFNYILSANYIWIFVEGLYLHLLISVSVMNEKSGLRWYILFGWASPSLFVIPWALVRLTQENILCWNTHPTSGYFWITRGPIVATIAVNFVFFLNILRVLFTKLNASNSKEAKKYRYIKLAKSTLVLIPLFGVHYIVFLGLPDNVNAQAELVKLYFEMFFNSFQGFCVAVLFCFLNGEVQAELRKKWNRHRLRQTDHVNNSFRRRSSHNWNTGSSYLPKMCASNYSSQYLEDKCDTTNYNGSVNNGGSNISSTCASKNGRTGSHKINQELRVEEEMVPMVEINDLDKSCVKTISTNMLAVGLSTLPEDAEQSSAVEEEGMASASQSTRNGSAYSSKEAIL